MQGIFLVAASSKLSLKSRSVIGLSILSWITIPITTSNVIFAKYFPMSFWPLIDVMVAFMGGMALYMYAFGYFKQHPIRRYSWLRLLAVIPEIILASIMSIVAENCAVVTMWFGNWYEFYIVQKESDDEIESFEADENLKNVSPLLIV
jgi:hypothetical protein